MKRTLAALLSLILLFSLHVPACAGDVFGQYVSALPAEVAIHCSEEALNVMGVEDLDELVRMVKYRAQPQAAELLRTSFPAFEEAARNNQLGTRIGLNILYDDKNAPMASVAWEKNLDDEGRFFLSYVINVNAFTLAQRDEAGNLIRDPETGMLHMTTDKESLDAFVCILTHEMMHVFMNDYNRSGMSGVIDPEVEFLPAYATDEDAAAAIAAYEATTFPRWFFEGCATMVEDAYIVMQQSYDELRTFGGGGPDGWYSPEDLRFAFAETLLPDGLEPEEYEAMADMQSCYDLRVSAYVSGYLACQYLAELAANSKGISACSYTPDGLETIDSAVLRSGLNEILRMLHEGVTLDDIIYSISNERFYDTEDFERAFIADDDDSAVFTAGLLNCFLRITRENGRSFPAIGSVLYPFDVDYLTPIDCTKNAQSGIYQIIDSRDLVASTANLYGVTDAGKSLSTLTYRSGAMQGAVPAYGYDGDYSYPSDPAYIYGGYYN